MDYYIVKRHRILPNVPYLWYTTGGRKQHEFTGYS